MAMVAATPLSRAEYDRLVGGLRQVKARLCLGLPIIGLTLAQLVPVARHGDTQVSVCGLLSYYDYETAARWALISAAATMVLLGWSALQSSRVSRGVAIVLALLNAAASVVLWTRLTDYGATPDFDAMIGYLIVPAVAIWAVIGGGIAGQYAD